MASLVIVHFNLLCKDIKIGVSNPVLMIYEYKSKTTW